MSMTPIPKVAELTLKAPTKQNDMIKGKSTL
jgi:hypothetical protein